jgi:hypothetical protein
MSILQIGKAINKLISEITPNVFPLIAEAGTKFPFVSYRRSGTQTSDTKDRYNYSEFAYIELAIYTNDYQSGISLAERIKSKLERFKGEIEGITINSIVLANGVEDYVGEAYLQSLTFSIEIDTSKIIR